MTTPKRVTIQNIYKTLESNNLDCTFFLHMFILR